MTVHGFSRAIGGGIALVAALALTACGTPASQSTQAAPAPVQTPAQAPEPQAPAAQTPAPEATPDPALTPSKTPAPPTEKKPEAAGPAVLKQGSTGAQVKDLQARLKQLRWFTGTITGNYGSTTTAAVKGYQAKRGLEATGNVDAKTLSTLKALSKTPTAEDLADKPASGPALLKQGSTGAQVKDLQARLKQIGWFSGAVTGNYGSSTTSSVKQFQAKRGLNATGAVDQTTLTKLQSMSRKPSADELSNKPAATAPAKPDAKKPADDGKAKGLDPRCMTGRVLCISKVSNKLWWLNDGKVIDSVSVRFGSDELPTREGTFQVNSKSKNHVSTIYHTKMPYAMFFSGGQAIHYSPDFAARGYNGASHGCVNVRDLGAIQNMFSQVSTGTKVIVYS